ncbi:hypothetical protein [Candidimonas nitroreducens]|uniref:Uncharacterized protein n=1 Tax=Candidimonas nitroreducens TaxID=683354 RepID=A0A225MKW9_9BURK|nr:hypothetical protein [Candidimonas nitroreducens]OWT62017.1 hypothetical protein CEY11_09430 [Candidimonas nitroreducens]
MTTAATQFPLIGSQPIGNFFAPDSTQRQPLGAIVSANDPYWGGGEYIYLQANATLTQGAAVTWNGGVGFKAIALPDTANQAAAVGFAIYPMASGQFGWFKISGQILANCTASVTAGSAVGITAAGQLGASSAGKEIEGASVLAPATTTVTKANATTRAGSNLVIVSDADGLFVGCPVSGTGIAASSYIGAISSDGRTLSLTASDLTTAKNATASGAITLTGTYNDGTTYYNVLYADRPTAQGRIT